MKKGDLVIRATSREEEFYYIPPFTTGVVLTDPYAAVFTKQEETGEAVYSFEKIVVDVLAGNSIIQKCPIDFIVRTERPRNPNKSRDLKKVEK
tara:strand:- start:439 stop:717 length:279 start_codon:yes stop_codon:yes gene_type:complete